MTKQAIINQDSFCTFLEIKRLSIESHKGCYALKFSTTFSNAKEPAAEQTKYQLFLTQQEFLKLKDLINAV